jgi:hypothetical protein
MRTGDLSVGLLGYVQFTQGKLQGHFNHFEQLTAAKLFCYN